MPEKAAYRLAVMALGMRMIGAVLALYAITQAVILIFAGKDRFSAPGWTVAMQIPGAPHSWGVVLGLAGLVLATAVAKEHWRVASWAAFGAGVWSMFFAVTFYLSAMNSGQASLTGIPTYLQNALIFVILGVTLRSLRT